MKRIRGTAWLLLSLAVVACSLAQPAPPRPTLVAPATPGPGSTPAPTPAPCTPAEPPQGDGIRELTGFPGADALEATDVTWTGSRFVAVGVRPISSDDIAGPGQGVVWTSCEGVAWQESVDPTFQYVTPLSVAALGNDLYVFGILATCSVDLDEECQDVAEAGNTIVRSVGGGPWERLALPPDLQVAYDLQFDAVGGRLLAHGASDDDEASYTLWQSANGSTWQPTTDLASMDPIDSLESIGSGILAFGSDYDDDEEATRLIGATSADGFAFSEVQVPDVPGASLTDVTAGPGGYAAVGVRFPDTEDVSTQAVALWSPDGTTWSEAAADDGSFTEAGLDEVHATATTYVAVGFRPNDADFTTQLSALWFSADGRTWREQQSFGDPTSVHTASALGPNGLVVFSTNQDDSGEEFESSVSVFFTPIAELVAAERT